MVVKLTLDERSHEGDVGKLEAKTRGESEKKTTVSFCR